MVSRFYKFKYLLESLFEKIFASKYKLFSAFFYIPFLYIIAWLISRPILLFSIDKETLNSVHLALTFFLFIGLIPRWFNSRWGIKKSYEFIGLKINLQGGLPIINLFKGIFIAVVLIIFLLLPILFNNWFEWKGELSFIIFLNGILVGLFYGFFEEVIFRGWLQEELKILFGLKMAMIIQSLIFSLVHGYKYISLSFGLFILGILLTSKKLKENGEIWTSIGIHGGLVGIWFITSSILDINSNAPSWIIGKEINDINPIGGTYGITLMIALIIFMNRKKIIKFKINN
tara:strand:- start:1055 stop:1915 length:861 start_codon:yes stop_codon:yes gene_type:complete